MIFLSVCFVFLAYVAASPWDNLTANIAIVELERTINATLSNEEVLLNSADRYGKMIISAPNETNIDMVIFPELSLGMIPQTSSEIKIADNPCAGDGIYHPAFVTLSCLAKTNNFYLVTNVVEKVKCSSPSSSSNENCRNTGYYYYNTNIVFDRNGTIAHRYRKYNLFGEFALDRPEKPDVVIFETDFGVKFATFTCFDILFKSPARDVVKEDIDGIIYPTNWHSELPFLTALQSQQMFAYAYDVMLFAAGGNWPVEATGGSGVHRGSKDSLFNTLIAKGGSQLLLYRSVNGEVEIDSPPSIDDLSKEMDSFPMQADNSLTNFTWIPLNTSQSTINEQVCHNDSGTLFCCNFSIDITTEGTGTTFYRYFLGAFSGIRNYPPICDTGVETCAIIGCLNSSISSCGKRFPRFEDVTWPVTFNQITIRAKFEDNENKTQFPNSLLSSIRPIDASQTSWTNKRVQEDGKDWIERTFSTNKAQNRLMTFAIYGRNFGLDVFPRDKQSDDNPGNDSSRNSITTAVVLLNIFLTLWCKLI